LKGDAIVRFADVGGIADHHCLKPYFHNGISVKCVISSQIDLIFQANKSQTQVMIYLLFVKCLSIEIEFTKNTLNTINATSVKRDFEIA
jgi:hypothetical protein